jgi:hypothetical protein
VWPPFEERRLRSGALPVARAGSGIRDARRRSPARPGCRGTGPCGRNIVPSSWTLASSADRPADRLSGPGPAGRRGWPCGPPPRRRRRPPSPRLMPTPQPVRRGVGATGQEEPSHLARRAWSLFRPFPNTTGLRSPAPECRPGSRRQGRGHGEPPGAVPTPDGGTGEETSRLGAYVHPPCGRRRTVCQPRWPPRHRSSSAPCSRSARSARRSRRCWGGGEQDKDEADGSRSPSRPGRRNASPNRDRAPPEYGPCSVSRGDVSVQAQADAYSTSKPFCPETVTLPLPPSSYGLTITDRV